MQKAKSNKHFFKSVHDYPNSNDPTKIEFNRKNSICLFIKLLTKQN